MQTLFIRDFMAREPICLRPDDTIREAAAVFSRHEIDGAPVVDMEVLQTGKASYGHKIIFRQSTVVANQAPVIYGDKIIGRNRSKKLPFPAC